MESIILGAKKAWATPTLPEDMVKLQLNPIIRIIRFLGGSSFLFILSKAQLNYHVYTLYIAMIFASVHTCYNFYLIYRRFKHSIQILKSDLFYIRNSPSLLFLFFNPRV